MRYLILLFRWFSYIGAGIVLFAAVLIGIDVFGRFVFNSPIKGAFELICLSYLSMSFVALARVQLDKRHLRVTFVSHRFKGRAGAVLDIARDSVMALFLAIILWTSFFEAIGAVRMHSLESGAFRVPTVAYLAPMAVGAFFGVAASVPDIISGLRRLFLPTQREPGPPEEPGTEAGADAL